VVGVILMGVGRRLGNVARTFNCRFEAIGNKVYFDIMKLLLPFCVFEFEVIVIVLSLYIQWIGIVIVIVMVILVELARNGFGV
jgi:fumarate reductase subunit D